MPLICGNHALPALGGRDRSLTAGVEAMSQVVPVVRVEVFSDCTRPWCSIGAVRLEKTRADCGGRAARPGP